MKQSVDLGKIDENNFMLSVKPYQLPVILPITELAMMAWSKTRNADETLFIFGIQDLGHTDQQFGQSVMSENCGFG